VAVFLLCRPSLLFDDASYATAFLSLKGTETTKQKQTEQKQKKVSEVRFKNSRQIQKHKLTDGFPVIKEDPRER